MELPEKDLPPEAIWLDPDALSEHFERVKARYASGASSSDDDRDDVAVPMNAESELTQGCTVADALLRCAASTGVLTALHCSRNARFHLRDAL